ncbi:hypothetical protein KOI35_22355 [Actinoplanes bogorensis]|uniref:Uncharacterized protein n=2 Tax=Paractinoplanes bogorensis TaxID=1610840 RepID=A0ABS5YSB6_9ACTN|nr:hypothetical protein [Actinoplanes bogorensis]
MTEALAPTVELPCGVVDLEADEYAIDPVAFALFVDALVRQYLSSNHTIFKELLAGYLPAAVVMVERSGRTIAALTGPIERSAVAISLDVDAFEPEAGQRELIRLVTVASRAMPAA